jgi:hypothetical protein
MGLVSAAHQRAPADAPGFPAEPLADVPPRLPGSIRRTSRLLMTWPDGLDAPLHVDGRARDVWTSEPHDKNGNAEILDEANLAVVFSPQTAIESIEVVPSLGDVSQLIGSGPGRGFRRALNAAFPEGDAQSSLAYFLVEDLTTAPLLSRFALSRRPETYERFRAISTAPLSVIEGVCAGYRPGGVAIELRKRGDQGSKNVAVVAPTKNDDPTAAWHPLEVATDLAMCRRRRIDVRRTEDALEVYATFRDHSWDLDGNESIVHEYELWAQVDEGTESGPTLRSLTARPRVIPYPDCPSAANEIGRLVGAPLSSLRTHVLQELRGVESCTHLNDMLRALAELPEILGQLPQV